jgi:hypothetical protein
MKPRHAAALALVGWYLMSPPQAIVKFDMAGVSAKNAETEVPKRVKEYSQLVDALPLSFWKTRDFFDTAQECKHQKVADGVKYDNPEFVFEKCVASDDPRLKSN